jgi:hypothetical protein
VGGSNSDTVFYSDRIGYPGAPPPWFASNTDAEPVAGGLRFSMKTSVRLARFWLVSTPNLKLGFG